MQQVLCAKFGGKLIVLYTTVDDSTYVGVCLIS